MQETTSRKAWPYLLGGLAVGTVLGVLFAPKRGREIRAEAADWLKDRRETGRAWIARFRDKFPAKKDQVTAAWRAGKAAYQEESHHKREVAHV